MSLLFVGTYTESNAPAIIEGQELGKGITFINMTKNWVL